MDSFFRQDFRSRSITCHLHPSPAIFLEPSSAHKRFTGVGTRVGPYGSVIGWRQVPRRPKQQQTGPAPASVCFSFSADNVRGASTPAESPEPPRATSSPVSEPSEEGRTGFLPVCHKQTGDFSTNDSLALTWGGDGERHVYLGEPQDGPSFSRQCYSRGVSRKPSSSPPGHRTPEAPAFFFSPEKPFDVNEENMQLLGDALGKKVPAIEMRGGESHTRTEMGSRTTRRGSRSGSRVSLQLRLLKKNSVDENASGTEFESKRGISGGGSTKLFRRQQCSSPPARPDGRGAGLRISEGKKGRRATEPGVPKVGPSRHSRLEESAYEAYQADVMRVRAS